MKENFDRFKFALYKEKEMPEFRKLIIALAGVALFAGLASAQVLGDGSSTAAFTCSTVNGSVTPNLRAEGYTEQTGDIVLICQGGSPPATNNGVPLPTANFTIFMNTAVTSRLLPTTNLANASEALLMIDEPGAGPAVTGYGPLQAQNPCGANNIGVGAGAGGCVEYLGTSTTQTVNDGHNTTGPGVPCGAAGDCGGVPVSNGVIPSGVNCTAATPCAPGANVFQGIVSGNQVSFFGIPVVPPGSTGSRVYRITNIRVNANGISAGGSVAGQATASISTSSGVPITNSTLTVGFVSQGLSAANTGVRNSSNTGNASSSGASFSQCSSSSITSTSTTAAAGLLQFAENFPTAFKPRQQSNLPIGPQNVPGTIYNSESGFISQSAGYSTTTTVFGTSYFPGQADYATRLKATFSNVPSGVSIFVSTVNVTNNFVILPPPNAVLVVSATATDMPNGTIPQASATTNVVTGTGPNVPVAPVAISSTGTGSAVWEITATGSNPASIDTDDFAFYISYSANAAANSPAPGTITVTLSYAPTPADGAFTSTTGAAASASLTIPRFSDSLDITKNVANFSLCTTALLYPYVINTNGFDTGLAVANTTTDIFGTTAQAGTCAFYFYGSGTPTVNPFVSPVVATGTVYANLASTLAPGFSGYMILNCNFQYAHGFGFVSDVGARNLAMGYLALVLGTGRMAIPENLNN
jgi:hypothetical protein